MSDIVKKLRSDDPRELVGRHEAADEIVALRCEVERLKVVLKSVDVYLTHGGASRTRIAQIVRAALGEQHERE